MVPPVWISYFSPDKRRGTVTMYHKLLQFCWKFSPLSTQFSMKIWLIWSHHMIQILLNGSVIAWAITSKLVSFGNSIRLCHWQQGSSWKIYLILTTWPMAVQPPIQHRYKNECCWGYDLSSLAAFFLSVLLKWSGKVDCKRQRWWSICLSKDLGKGQETYLEKFVSNAKAQHSANQVSSCILTSFVKTSAVERRGADKSRTLVSEPSVTWRSQLLASNSEKNDW